MSAQRDRIRRAWHRAHHHGKRAREGARRRRTTDIGWRVGVFVVGMTLLAGGALMLVLPGPGWLVIFLGLGVLATEFDWAQRLLDRVKRYYHHLRAKAVAKQRRRRRRSGRAL